MVHCYCFFICSALADINPARWTKCSKLKSSKVPAEVLRLLSELLAVNQTDLDLFHNFNDAVISDLSWLLLSITNDYNLT